MNSSVRCPPHYYRLYTICKRHHLLLHTPHTHVTIYTPPQEVISGTICPPLLLVLSVALNPPPARLSPRARIWIRSRSPLFTVWSGATVWCESSCWPWTRSGAATCTGYPSSTPPRLCLTSAPSGTSKRVFRTAPISFTLHWPIVVCGTAYTLPWWQLRSHCPNSSLSGRLLDNIILLLLSWK